MKPRTIADAIIAKHGVNEAWRKVRARTRFHLYSGPMDNSHVHRAVFWIVVGQMVEKVGNSAGWT